MTNDRYQPRRIEGWVARPDTQRALRDLRARDAYIVAHGLPAYIAESIRQGRPLPYPFNDQRRWPDIAEDEDCPADWRQTARWLIDQAATGRIGTWPDPI